MSIEAARVRDAAAYYREAARNEAAAIGSARAAAKRDDRIEEAKDSAAARPRPQDNAQPALARAPSPNRLVDILT
jgi:hypothetical protein